MSGKFITFSNQGHRYSYNVDYITDVSFHGLRVYVSTLDGKHNDHNFRTEDEALKVYKLLIGENN